jgi:[protein-PII] uridylyltransferase
MPVSYLALRAELVERGGMADAGAALCRRLTAALDADLASLLPRDGGRLALVAVGGYGRGELCLYSDVDLMLLHTGSVPARAVEQTFYPLWDAGLKVGHAVRSVREAVQAAREQFETLTALLDARLLAGDDDLFGELRHALGELLRRGRIDLTGELAARERVRRQAEPYLLQELNIKDGRGGLRALQSMHWERRAAEIRALTPRPPLPSRRERGSHDQPRSSSTPLSRRGGRGAGGEGHLDSLLATRNALHAISGKAFDVYAHDLHQAIADWLQVDAAAWSQRLYQAAYEIDRAVWGHWQQVATHTAEPARRLWNIPAFLTRRTNPDAAPSSVPSPQPSFYAGSVLTMAARAAALPNGPAFDATQSASIQAAMGPMWTAEDREGFLALLRAGGRGREVFDALDALGWAERALPEWAHVRGLPQYAPFHLHPVDTHLWRTVEEMLAIAQRDSPEPPLAGVASGLDSMDDALLAALLHDIGKGWPGDHAVSGAQAARAFCRRARFGPRTAATVSRAIEHHLLLPNVATRRDLDDPAVINDVADAVGDQRTLRVLYLLSVADARATGPAVWSPWKGTLLRSLYERTDDELRRREHAVRPPQPPFDPAPVIAAVRAVAGESVVRQHLASMPAGYTDTWTVDEIAQHVRLMWPAPSGAEVRLEVAHGGPADDLTLALEDRPGLLAITSGVLALHNISVLGGRFSTRSDGVALQALHVVDALGQGIDETRWQRVRNDIPRALRAELDLETALREKMHDYRRHRPARRRITPRVVVDARTSSRATLVEVHAEDRVGLLHAITRALFDLGLDIHVAKVDTLGREVVDVFYVRDLAGHPPRAPEQLAAIEAGVLGRLRDEG